MPLLNFVNSDLKQKVDQLMDELWSGGVNIPTTSIEQISYLMFLKSLSEMDEKHAELAKKAAGKYKSLFSGSWAKYSWRTIARLSGDELYNIISEAFEKYWELPNLSGIGKTLFKQAHLKIYSRPTLRSVVSIIDGMDYNNTKKYDTDVKGDLYEYLLSKIKTSGTNGQFRTPRHIIDFMVKLVDPQPCDYILDPACGTAGFLIQAYKHMLEENTSKEELKEGYITGDKLKPSQHKFLKEHALTGYDNDAEMIKFAIMNLYLHGLENANVQHFDPLCWQNNMDRKYDVVLANPPFSGSIKKESILEDINLNTSSTELLFVKYMADHLAPKGRAAIVIPDGLLYGSTDAHTKLKSFLLKNFSVKAIVSLPAGAFRPYTGKKASVIIFSKTNPSEKIWFYEIKNDGFSLDDKRIPIDENDIPDLMQKWGEKPESENSWHVDIAEIIKNDYNLATSKYKDYHVDETKKIDPGDVINRIIDNSEKIKINLKELLEIYNEQILHKKTTWTKVTLGQIAKIGAGNSAPQEKEYFKNGIYSFVRTSDLGKVHQSVNFCTSRDKVNDKAINKFKLKLWPKKTILFPKSGASVFLNHRVMLGIDAYISSHLATIVSNPAKVIPEFLYYTLLRIDSKHIVPDTDYPSVKIADIANVKIFLPSLEEQKLILKILDKIERVKEKQNESREDLDIFFGSVIQMTFNKK